MSNPFLDQALAAVAKLPPAEQDAIAARILQEIADDRQWDEAFARSQDQLGRIADRVREDIRAGRVRDVGGRRPLHSDTPTTTDFY